MITLDQFKQVEMRVGLVVEASEIEGSIKLIRLVVDIGDDPPVAPDAQHLRAGKRIIFTAVRPFGYTPDYFLFKKFLFVTNLEPKKMMDEESQGMILAVDSEDKPLFISAEGLPVGAKVR